jgi:hypothetical protein
MCPSRHSDCSSRHNMKASHEHASFPQDLQLEGASFYSSWGLVSNINNVGPRGGHECVVFDYDSNTGEGAHTDTVVAIKAESPKTPARGLSRASGLRLERVGERVFAFEPERRVDSGRINSLVDDVLKLLEYAKAFPQNR